ncbi:NAD(P)/FAD-dependent oxidoreductase [Anabaena sphaerica FACHB-251]|uniref:NAD(P)/FAD-dependent oxidoreductase n=1 Tax=Anabaena sphaerica FACHB-251 TaxID=2692883 RepID=A0A926WK07_9NOST|nr:NAD(P)/FAD-dependent oxidoreductase [Anabaena sphaerica]MBD2295842.1 NAD(P)/FAD-dependent oxidoreductase [Anabaena sphaerica FACHB-251]
MKIDYDIVIIGGSIAGYQAALTATQLHAKVALVQPQVNYELNYHYAFNNLGKISQDCLDMANLGIITQDKNTAPDIHLGEPISNTVVQKKSGIPIYQTNCFYSYKQAMLYAQGIAANFNQVNSLANLAAQGVDVIIGSGKFSTSQPLTFAVNDRILSARTYLLACGSRPQIPDIEGLQTTGYVTLANIWQFLEKSNSPKNWIILGGLPQSIEIAQTLARLGCSINLIVNHPSVFSHLDPEIAELLIAELEADGVRIFQQTIVTQVRQIEDKKWVQAGDKAIETDEILVATAQQPNIEFLNLAAAGVKWHSRRLVVNEKLQTTNQRIYACGDIIGGYDIANVANYEAKIAVKNALFYPRLSVNYRCIPWVISSQPMVAQVGLTETQAKRRYSKNQVLVFKNYFKTITAAQIKNEITGICKLTVLENGKILGCSILGAEAGELINLIALAMSQNLKIENLENLASVYPSFSEILEQTARGWSQQRLNKNQVLQEFLQSFFHLRRDWNL